mmetsp:Transcript_9279/g.23101  ORF Transcript_9279/g.23101 Transcript_9279/m.23101 type:complete len:217 (-) Transcript_9279:757-1407(-)
MMPIVPNEEPHAYEMTWASTATSAGRDQRGSPSVSARARKSAVCTCEITSPRAHASSSTNIGSSTSFIPSTHACTASSSDSTPWLITSPIDTSHPAADDHTSAFTESEADSTFTRLISGRLSSGYARIFATPSYSMPPNVPSAMVPKGSSAFIARYGTPFFGARGPSSLGSTSAAEWIARLAGGCSGRAYRAIGPRSLPDASKMGTSSSRRTGRKR